MATRLLEAINHRLGANPAPMVIAIDGRSGAGKSTLARVVADVLQPPSSCGRFVTVIEGDEFYTGGSAAHWDARTPIERAANVIDWRRQRAVLVSLLHHGSATWHGFEWNADWDAEDVPLSSVASTAVAGRVVILEGAYSARPELHDLLDLRVLLDPPADVRRQRLLEREGEEYRTDWESRWSSAEDHYFGHVMPPDRFDLVL